MRKRKLASEKFKPLQVRPHLSKDVPNREVVLVILNTDVDFAVVHVVPPSQDNCTQNLGELEALLTFPVSFTSIPWIVAAVGTLRV